MTWTDAIAAVSGPKHQAYTGFTEAQALALLPKAARIKLQTIIDRHEADAAVARAMHDSNEQLRRDIEKAEIKVEEFTNPAVPGAYQRIRGFGIPHDDPRVIAAEKNVDDLKAEYARRQANRDKISARAGINGAIKKCVPGIYSGASPRTYRGARRAANRAAANIPGHGG